MVQATPATREPFNAFVYTSFGVPEQELKLRYDFPQAPLEPLQVRIKVHSAALNPVDYKILQNGARFFPTSPSVDTPFRIGFDAAGTVAELGADVKDFHVGDAVYTMTPFTGFGTVGEFINVDSQYVAPKPVNLDFDHAASVPLAALTSYQALLAHGNVQKGDRVLILGGSGGTGIFAVQIAKALGARVITTTSFRNAEFVKTLGADEVIDYTKEKWVDLVEPHSIDVLYDCGMEPNSWNDDAQRVLKKDTGRFVTILGVTNPIESTIGAKFTHARVQASAADLKVVTSFIEKGQVVPIIDSIHPFANLVDAVNTVKSSRARGKVVVQVLREGQQ